MSVIEKASLQSNNVNGVTKKGLNNGVKSKDALFNGTTSANAQDGEF